MQPLNDIVLNNANVIDITNGTIRNNQNIHISGGFVSQVRSGPFHSLPSLTQYFDVAGLWIIPGLIDAHVHIFEEPDPNLLKDFRFDENLDFALERAMRNISTALNAGITTVRDMGAYDARNNLLRDRAKREPQKYKCRIVSCGSHITKPNGHFFTRGYAWRGKTSLRETVKRIITDGADFIKVMNDDIIFDRSELEEIIQTSHHMGKRVACHAVFPPSIKLAIEVGSDTVEHAYPFDSWIADQMIDQGTILCPTFIAAKDSVQSQKAAETVAEGLPDCSSEELYKWYEYLLEALPIAFKRGVLVIAGTDAGTTLTPFDSLHRELCTYVNMGLSDFQALQTATILSACALELEDVIGSVSIGKSADLVVLGTNPLESLKTALSDIRMVVSRGAIVKASIDNSFQDPK
jgi:imidazolonepropionase-like amidohydrolase